MTSFDGISYCYDMVSAVTGTAGFRIGDDTAQEHERKLVDAGAKCDFVTIDSVHKLPDFCSRKFGAQRLIRFYGFFNAWRKPSGTVSV